MAICKDRRLVHFRLCGVLHTIESERALIRYTQDPAFDPTYTFLTDARGLTEINSGFLEIIGAAHRLRHVLALFDRPVNSVLICPSDLSFGMARIMQQVIEPLTHFTFHIARTETQALKAAGIHDTTLADLEHEAGFTPI
ncbi:hypothetical protein [Thetidibacter halocola]|uniref:Uncharacterized protein n=1 Tax=Thetidibacter halocola TaxID=2827239 RepID=A0A8J8B7H0_9RHOB|nr:hypothetical protein [Thetidibacter halocola]MBS0124412.1 hypothetical protein [Thetidibacter halocola]